MNKTTIEDLLKDIPPLVWLAAKLWDKREQTRKYKQKLPRKCLWARAEKEREWRKYTTRSGQFQKRVTMLERKRKERY